MIASNERRYAAGRNSFGTSVLELPDSTITLPSQSLETLLPGQRLNSDVVFGAIRLIEVVSGGKIKVVDLQTPQPEQRAVGDLGNATILMPLVHDNHWVLGVDENRTGALIYESRLSDTKEAVLGPIRTSYSLLADTRQLPADQGHFAAAPSQRLRQRRDDYHYGFQVAFPEVTKNRIEVEIDTAVWREMLLCLLGPLTTTIGDLSAETLEPRVHLPVLSADALLSKASEALSRFLCEFSTAVKQLYNEVDRESTSARLALECVRRTKEAATSGGITDIMARLQRAEEACQRWTQQFTKERDHAYSLWQRATFLAVQAEESGTQAEVPPGMTPGMTLQLEVCVLIGC